MLQKQLTILKECRAAAENTRDANGINRALLRAKAALAVAFGENSSLLLQVTQINWRYNTRGLISYVDIESGTTVAPDRSAALHRHFVICCSSLASILDSAIEQLEIKMSTTQEQNIGTSLAKVIQLLDRFHLIAGQLGIRYSNRSTLKISDEYDLQDLLHSLLWLHFTDIRREEYTPSRAGANSRTDFLLKNEKIVIEAKIASNTLTDRKIGEQLIVDIERYKSHPDCQTLVAFVYDPDEVLVNPRGLENDLNRSETGYSVVVLVRPA